MIIIFHTSDLLHNSQFFHETEILRKQSFLQTESRPLTVRIEKFHIIIQIIAAR